jgi:uncharacterized protein involved in type VI secretion and phage assembly
MSAEDLFDGGREPETGRHVSGVVTGIVTDNEDPEGLGRVKLRFPWRSSDDPTGWVRVTAPMAGESRGTFFLPEVGDEVLVAFEHGDIHFPYVIGALWNSDDVPPVETAAQVDVRMLRSRTGHEIVLDDTDGSERVEVRTAGGHEIRLDDGNERVSVTDSAGQSVALDAGAGSVTIEGATTLSLSAQSIELSGDVDVSISSNGQLSLEGAIIKLN